MVARATLLSICLYFALSAAVPIPQRFTGDQAIQQFDGRRPDGQHRVPMRDGDFDHRKPNVRDNFPRPDGERLQVDGPHQHRDGQPNLPPPGRPEQYGHMKRDYHEYGAPGFVPNPEHPEFKPQMQEGIVRDFPPRPHQGERRFGAIDGHVRSGDRELRGPREQRRPEFGHQKRDFRERHHDHLRQFEGHPEFLRADEHRTDFRNQKRDFPEQRRRERLREDGRFDRHGMEGEQGRVDGRREHFKRDIERDFRPEIDPRLDQHFRPEQHDPRLEQHEFRRPDEQDGHRQFEHQKRAFSEFPEQRDEPRRRLDRYENHRMEEDRGRVLGGRKQFKRDGEDFRFPHGQRGIERMGRFPLEEGRRGHKHEGKFSEA